MRTLLLLAATLLANSAVTPASAYTYLSGNLPATLTAAQSPYVALTVLTLLNATCTIEPAVVVYFTVGTGIDVRGTSSLIAVGTSTQQIELRGYQGAAWRSIEFYADGYSKTLALEHCLIQGANRAVYIPAGGGFTVTIRHCEIDATNGEAGIWFRDHVPALASTVLVQSTSVVGGTYAGFYFYEDSSGDTITVTECTATDALGTGFWMHGPGISASGLVALRNDTGARLSYGTLADATLRENGMGIVIGGSLTAPPMVEGSRIIDNATGVLVTAAARFTDCSLFDNVNWDVYCTAPVLQFTTIDMRGCYWGPTTTQEMIAEGTFSDISTIFDWWDNSQYSLVDYEGFLAPIAVRGESWASVKARFR